MKVVCENYNGTNDDNDKGNNVNDIACDDNGAVADGACDDDNGEGDGEGDRHDDHTNIKQASHQQELIIKQASHQQEQLIKETEQVTNQTLNEFIIQPKEVKKKKTLIAEIQNKYKNKNVLFRRASKTAWTNTQAVAVTSACNHFATSTALHQHSLYSLPPKPTHQCLSWYI